MKGDLENRPRGGEGTPTPTADRRPPDRGPRGGRGRGQQEAEGVGVDRGHWEVEVAEGVVLSLRHELSI